MKLIPQTCPPPAFESFTSVFYLHSLINLNRWSILKWSKAVEPNFAVIKRRIFQLYSHHCISLSYSGASCPACHHLPDLSHTHANRWKCIKLKQKQKHLVPFRVRSSSNRALRSHCMWCRHVSSPPDMARHSRCYFQLLGCSQWLRNVFCWYSAYTCW